MFTIIFEVTAADEIIALIPASGEVCRKKLSQDDANFYRRRLKEDIMVRTYFHKIPGEILGRYSRINPILNTTDNFFYFIPSINSLLI